MLDDNYSLNDNYSTKIICQKSLALHNRLMEQSLADSQHKYEYYANHFQFTARKKRENLFREENSTKEKDLYLYRIEISKFYNVYLFYKKQEDTSKPIEIIKITEFIKKRY